MKSTTEITKLLFGLSLILVLALAFARPTMAGYVDEVLADNPIAYWRFEETSGSTATDSAGSNDGTYNNVALGQTSAFAALGNAARFNGTSSFVSVPSLGSFNNLTLEAWIKPASFPPPGNWAALYNTDGFSTNDSHWQLRHNQFEWAIGGKANSLSSFTFDADTWYHVVTTFQQSSNRADLYINGQHQEILFFANPDTHPLLSAARIGSWNFSRFFHGEIDEVAVYATALSADRISAHFNTVVPPTAEAGANQSIHVGQTVQLDGSGSSDDTTPTQNLQYAWSFTSVSPGSTATLSDPHAINPTFVADLLGTYVVSLVVTDADGLASKPDEVTISSLNAPPNAEAGPDQGTFVGDLVTLSGSASNDPDFDPITFAWTLITQPAGSTATLSNANTATPTFVPDLPGSYVAELIVSDPFVASAPDQVTIAVITAEDFAEQQTVDAINTLGSLPPSSVTTKGNQTALGNFLTQVIAALQVGDVGEAKKKLQDAIERTDGCALRGSPDLPGGGQIKQDYIKTCTDQAPVYTLLKDALDALSGP